MKKTTIFIIVLLIVSCSQSKQKDARKEVVVERYAGGEIKKTYNGYTYGVYDKEGRRIEFYGNLKFVDANSNFHTIINYQNKKVVIKEYVLEDSNTECIITDKDDYVKFVMYFEGSDFEESIKFEVYQPVKKNGKYIKHELSETRVRKSKNYHLRYLPDYLR